MPASISLIRHAEKQTGDGPPLGVLADGSADPESLTPRGWQRAGALVGLFAPRADRSGAPLLATPAHLFACDVGPGSRSRRPLETLLPLSERLGTPVEGRFQQDDIDRLLGAVRECDGDVLIAWEHKRLPVIAARLVSEHGMVPSVWPDDRFDLIWIFTRDETGGGYRLRQVPQLLLAGDRSQGIAGETG